MIDDMLGKVVMVNYYFFLIILFGCFFIYLVFVDLREDLCDFEF